MYRLTVIVATVAVALLATKSNSQHPPEHSSILSDSGWDTLYHQSFDGDFEATDGQSFGVDNWLTFQLINGGAITAANGYAQVSNPDFWNAALIRSTGSLPDEYKVRTKIGYVEYDLANYEQADYDHPDFNTHSGHYENGVYFLTITDDTCIGVECAEEWWHYHRKMVVDVDNHLDGSLNEVFHPLYMVYMAPETNSGGNLLRTWDGTAWDTSPWNWKAAYTYDYDQWYYAELEKADSLLVLRFYDASQVLIEETTPVPLDLVNAMDDPHEYLYIGEPHTDDYEGSVRIDEITLLVPESAVDVDDGTVNPNLPTMFTVSQNYPNPFNPETTVEYSLPERSHVIVEVFNVLGQRVIDLVDREMSAGNHRIMWNGRDASGHEVASGVYLYRLRSEEHVETRKMLHLK